MSEVSGKVVFRTHDSELASKIKNLSDDVTWEELHALLQMAEVDDLDNDDEEITVYVDGIFIEERIFHDDLIILRVFGEAWLDVLQDLLESEKLELWSKLWHECGTAIILPRAKVNYCMKKLTLKVIRTLKKTWIF